MAGLWAAIIAAVINAILFFIYHTAGVISDTIFVQPGKPLSVIPVIFTSIIPALIASMVFFLFEKYTQKLLHFVQCMWLWQHHFFILLRKA